MKTEQNKDKSSKNSGWKRWIHLRFNLKPILKHVVYHRVAKNPWYYGDGASLLALIGVLVVTGLFMTLTYSASPETAYDSVLKITNDMVLGSFVRGLHYWSAGFVIIILLYHTLRHVALGGYLPPREGIWLIGVFLFLLVITTSLIGYILRWDERSIYAFMVALNIFHKIPFMGDEIVRFIQGGDQLSIETLSRLYSVHTLFIPLTLAGLIAYHLYLILSYGATTPLEKKHAPATAEEQILLRHHERHDPETGHEFFPSMVARTGTVAFVVLLTVAFLAATWGPQELFPEANLTKISFPQEEWWFHWYSGLTAYLPSSISDQFHWLFPVFIFLTLVAIPFVDRGTNRGPQRRPLALASVSIIVMLIFGFTGLRFKSPWTAWPRVDLPPIPQNAKLTDSVFEGRKLFTEYGCFNCHAVGGYGSLFASNLTGLKHRYSHQELQKFISQPPVDVSMPSYGDRMSDSDLRKIVDFVLVIQTFPREY